MPLQPAVPAAADLAHRLEELRGLAVVRALVAACGPTECHLVGGVLRDWALGLESRDLDAVVAGRGREIAARLAAALGARLVLLGGKEFAAWRLVAGDLVVDLWDREGMPLADDLARRDFTVDACALAPETGALVDPFGGLADMAHRVLRATTRASFEGDALRVLRLPRLALQLPGFNADPDTVDLARRAAPRLWEVAAERIREELWRIFAHPGAAAGFALLGAAGAYEALWLRGSETALGEADAIVAEVAAELGALERCAAELRALAAGSPLPLELDLPAARLAISFSPGASAAALAAFRQHGFLTRQVAAEVAAVLAPPPTLPETEIEGRRFLFRTGNRWGTIACLAGSRAAALGPAASERWRRAAAALARLVRDHGAALVAPPRLLTGAEIQELLGLPPGPEIGRLLAALAAAQVDGKVATRAEAQSWLRAEARHGAL